MQNCKFQNVKKICQIELTYALLIFNANKVSRENSPFKIIKMIDLTDFYANVIHVFFVKSDRSHNFYFIEGLKMSSQWRPLQPEMSSNGSLSPLQFGRPVSRQITKNPQNIMQNFQQQQQPQSNGFNAFNFNPR